MTSKSVLHKPELLSPAGNLEKLTFAFQYGADGAYIGGKFFNLRKGAGNFSLAELKKAGQLADKHNKKLYLAINVYFKNKDFKKLGIYCEQIYNAGIRNIIISDMGVLNFINKNFKKSFHISISTQANVTNYYAIDLLKQFNVNRIILARELKIKEIEEIKAKINMELETFIHGAMCVAYSGRCLLSEYLTGRSANRGDCVQSCRWDYYLMEKSRKDQFFPVTEDKSGTTILSSKDLCTVSILKKLIKAGIDSFKIEGRMKSLYYTANVTRVYRKAIDSIINGRKPDKEFLLKELDMVSHRPYFSGFYVNNKSTITYNKSYVRKVQFIGYLKRKKRDNLYELVLKNKLEKQDKIEIILPDMRNIQLLKYKLYDKNLNKVDRGVINNKYYIEMNKEAAELGIIRIRKSS